MRQFFNCLNQYYSGQIGVEDALIKKLEKEGLNVLPAFGYPGYKIVENFLLDNRGDSRVDAIISFVGTHMSSFEGGKDLLNKLGVPILNLITIFGKTEEEWRASKQGLSPEEISFQFSISEIFGLIQPSVVGAKKPVIDTATGFQVTVRHPITENVERLVDRIKAWINLQRKENSRKKVALIYYNYPPGKQNIGASYLNVFDSIEEILKKMRSEGYSVGDQSIEKDVLLENALSNGRNVANWAAGKLEEMVKSGQVILLPLDEYQGWFERLPAEFRESVIRDWGRVEESDVMIWHDKDKDEKYLVIPGTERGNVIIAPQPIRGWSQNKQALYHSSTLAPHHQYVAFYLWLKFTFGADAIIHVGTHGTLEWLPGKQAGLSLSDPPEALIQDLPDIYPYIVDVVGEGLQAKRRGAAVIIDHMIPPLKKGGLYKEYAELNELISDHDVALQKNPTLAKEYVEEIKKTVLQLGLAKDLEIEERIKEKGIDHETIHEIEEYLQELKEKN
ncbi:MAG: cobaltochelatase subunit CobN, partial [Anaerolineae bacterium]